MKNNYIFDLKTKILSKDNSDRIQLFLEQENVKYFLSTNCELRNYFSSLSEDEKAACFAVIAIEQAMPLFMLPLSSPLWSDLLANLLEIDQFYHECGGIVGYHALFLSLLLKKQNPSKKESLSFSHPPLIDLAQDSQKYTEDGLKTLPDLAEIYPAGGAGDRLSLIDAKSGQARPAAELEFCGKTLLERLFEDLEAREHLYFKKFGRRIQTPIAIMCSQEKNNLQRVRKILEENHFFGRSKSLVRIFEQCLVPVIDHNGTWCIKEAGKMHLKPGGHGAIWKAARDQGIFSWLKNNQRSKILIRQINNPIAGTDHTLLSFTGACKNYNFAFLSCQRLLGANEGMLVQKNWKEKASSKSCLCNVEYTSLKENGIEDLPIEKNSPYSKYPSNTNILFADISCIEELVDKDPYPGTLINMKSSFPCLQTDGTVKEKIGGRLEFSMQNIADQIFMPEDPKDQQKQFSSCIAYNDRKKTLAVTKQLYSKDKGLRDTPEEALEVLLKNFHELLSKHCGVNLPKLWENYEETGPSFFCLFDPIIGPLYSEIAKKITRGHFQDGFELQVKIAQVLLKNLDLCGSLIIETKNDSRQKDRKKNSKIEAKCSLDSVNIVNQGIDWGAKNCFWKNKITRKETVYICLHGNAQFYAKDLSFIGHQAFEVPSGKRLIVEKEGTELSKKLEDI